MSSTFERTTRRGAPAPGARRTRSSGWLHLLPKTVPALEGLLALVVTDLEGFTPLVGQLGDVEARDWIRTHNRLLRQAIRRRAGQEVAHTGDGIIAAFRSVSAALHYAQDVQRSLQAHSRANPHAPLRARIGVHAGEPLPEDGRLFGRCVNAAVRVCGYARAEQVLVTDVIRQLAEGGTFSFAPAEAVRLKGLSAELSLYELTRGAHA